MYNFLKIWSRIRHYFVFLILEIIASVLIVGSYYYHNMGFIHSSNYITGKVYSAQNFIENQFTLESENQRIIQENIALKAKVSTLEGILSSSNQQYEREIKDSAYYQHYSYINAKVIHNSVTMDQNYITLNKGTNAGVKKDMGVITNQGLIGIVESVSAKYSVVKSVLNRKNSIIIASVKGKDFYGSLIWNNKDFHYITLRGIPKHKKVKVGDIVTSTNNSRIYPAEIPIGKIVELKLDEEGDSYNGKVQLYQNFANLSNVYVVNEIDKKEIDTLLNDTIQNVRP